uniref:Uncharacterized protein n=1 Tax=Leersia perrieri TaxID=77586 RepID=A0A0D9W255_9ORYZ
MADNHSDSASTDTTTTTSSQNPRTCNKLPDTKLIITTVDQSVFASTCGIIGHEFLGVLHDDFKKILTEKKELA